jgi:hypothetical protein
MASATYGDQEPLDARACTFAFAFAEPGVRCVIDNGSITVDGRDFDTTHGLGCVKCASAVSDGSLVVYEGVTQCTVVRAAADGMCHYQGTVFRPGSTYTVSAQTIKFTLKK